MSIPSLISRAPSFTAIVVSSCMDPCPSAQLILALQEGTDTLSPSLIPSPWSLLEPSHPELSLGVHYSSSQGLWALGQEDGPAGQRVCAVSRPLAPTHWGGGDPLPLDLLGAGRRKALIRLIMIWGPRPALSPHFPGARTQAGLAPPP